MHIDVDVKAHVDAEGSGDNARELKRTRENYGGRMSRENG